MHIFKDKTGYEWTLDLNLGSAFEIESENFAQAFNAEPGEDGELPFVRLDFINPDDKFFQIYLTNTRVVFTIVWILCREQASKINIGNMEEFAKRFDGEAFDNARKAFYEELPDFFPSRKMTLRASIHRYSDAVEEMDKRLSQEIETKMNREAITKYIDEELKDADIRFQSESD